MRVEKIISVAADGYNYTCGYHTSNKWIDNDRIVLARSITAEISSNSELVVYTISTDSFSVISNKLNSWLDYVVLKSSIYYLAENKIRRFDIDSGCDTELASFGDLRVGSPHLTHDGRYMSLFSYSATDGMIAYRFDTESKNLERVFSKQFEMPLPIANHLMISPTEPSNFFFAHEGDTRQINDRLWIYNEQTGMRNIAMQSVIDGGVPEDCFGHEAWAPDGRGIYFVKYPLSLSVPYGIAYADISGCEYKILYSAYDYWHVSVSQCGKYLAADTIYPGKSQIVFIDVENNTEELIEITESRKKHPNHPHPTISPAGNKVAYNSIDSRGFDCVRIAFIEK